MREIYKRITLPIDGTPHEFRLCKLDAFSGARLLQLVRKYLPATDLPQSNLPKAESTHSNPAQAGPNPPQAPKQKTEQTKVEKGSGPTVADLISPIFQALPPDDLRALMTMALSHTDVLLDAGWQPLMQQGEWSWPDIEYDPATALRLTLESALWSLDSFFTGIGSPSRPAEI